jgi:hypothetical protein
MRRREREGRLVTGWRVSFPSGASGEGQIGSTLHWVADRDGFGGGKRSRNYFNR